MKTCIKLGINTNESKEVMSRVLSGIQPTGNLHIGNYLGAIKQWVDMQGEHESLFCIVDLHAITTPQNPVELNRSIYLTAATYIACGIDPENSLIFSQSSIKEHTELAWYLGCFTPLGWLNRMTQFKEKAGKKKDMASLGLYGYPVLMAADILLYKATHVPVGEDQKQHLELARDIAGAFNRYYDQEYFPLPEPFIMGPATRVMSLRDGTKKMSKSDESDYSRIHLTDSKDDIAKKIKKAKSDSEVGISYDEEKRPEASNLINIYSGLSGIKRETIIADYENKGFADFKKDLAELACEKIGPISERIHELMENVDYLESILDKGADRARSIGFATAKEVRGLVGLYKS